jgi:hypothetical protein
MIITKPVTDFSGGIKSYTDPTKINEMEFPIYENAQPKSFGKNKAFNMRFGYDQYNTHQFNGTKTIVTLYEALFSSGAVLVGNDSDSSSSLMRYVATPYTGAFTSISGSGGSAFSSQLQYAMLRDRLYIANVNDGSTAYANRVWDKTNFLDAGCPPCNVTAMTASAGATGVLNGLYHYVVTFEYDGKQESATIFPIDSSSLLPRPIASGLTNKMVDLAGVPTGNARVTARKIYRTKTNTYAPLYYLTTLNDNTTTTYTDNMPDANLGTEADTTGLTDMQKPYISKYLCTHKDRLVSAYLTENYYTPLTSADVTVASSATAGSLTANGAYTFRFYKVWRDNLDNAGNVQFRYSLPYTVTGQLTGGNQSFDISYIGTNSDFGFIAFEMATTNGGAVFGFPTIASLIGTALASFPINTGIAGQLANPMPNIFASQFGIQTTYNSNVSISNAGTPDLTDRLNDKEIAFNNGDFITGLHGETNRVLAWKQKSIYAINTDTLDSTYWYTTKLIDGIGADDYSVKQFSLGNGFGYVWKSSRYVEGIGTFEIIYLWDGLGEPKPIGYDVLGYFSANSVTTFVDVIHDSSNNYIRIIMSGGLGKNEMIYDLSNNMWVSNYNNNTTLAFNCYCNTKSYGVLIGDTSGYVNYYNKALFRDKIATVATDYTANVQTKTFMSTNADLFLRRLTFDIEAGANFTGLIVNITVDGGTTANLTITGGVASAFNRLKTTLFTSINTKPFRQYYIAVSPTFTASSVRGSFKLLGITPEFQVKHQSQGGR